MLVCKKKNMLYHDTIDQFFDVDAYCDRREGEPFVFEVEEECAKAWIDNNEAADGVNISVAPAAVAPPAVIPATAVDEVQRRKVDINLPSMQKERVVGCITVISKYRDQVYSHPRSIDAQQSQSLYCPMQISTNIHTLVEFIFDV